MQKVYPGPCISLFGSNFSCYVFFIILYNIRRACIGLVFYSGNRQHHSFNMIFLPCYSNFDTVAVFQVLLHSHFDIF